MELIYDYHNYSEEIKVKLAVIEFTDYTIICWNQLVKNMRKNQERFIKNWGKLKVLMRKRFIPSHYYMDFQRKL